MPLFALQSILRAFPVFPCFNQKKDISNQYWKLKWNDQYFLIFEQWMLKYKNWNYVHLIRINCSPLCAAQNVHKFNFFAKNPATVWSGWVILKVKHYIQKVRPFTFKSNSKHLLRLKYRASPKCRVANMTAKTVKTARLDCPISFDTTI